MATMFSTKGRYALRVMYDLGCHESWVSLGEISKRQDISRKYLEQVCSLLVKSGLIVSQRGKAGGYMLAREPKDIAISEILSAVEGGIHSVACLSCKETEEECPRKEWCPTVPLWRALDSMTANYLDSKTLADIVPDQYEEVPED